MFDKVITPEFKKLFKDSIDTLLATNALSVPCTLKFESINRELCYNCEFDPITKRSANIPKDSPTIAFAHQSICPVCNGFGFIDKAKDEIITLGIIFDSKYWMNWGSESINISDGMVQSICSITLLPKIKNCKEMIIDNNISTYGNYRYSRAGEPNPVGLGSNDYIITMWQKS